MKIPVILQKMNNIFEKNGFKAYLVGGAVRDMFMNKEASDWDVATDATPEQVISAFKKVIPTGIAHGTVTVHFMGEEIEVTTFRIEQGYSDGRHPDKVSYASDIEEDLSRRDFTMNAIAVSLKDGSIVDPFNGKADIKNKVIRSVGNPLERFNEDGLRPIRAI
ncbi:MAG: polynucleotide adenylyltransferase, partial [Treponema sp.]|nr:polynucleotide adenylyltransferase [Treponema sp.]